MSVEAGMVRLLCVLPEPIERVWAYLTESEPRGRWLASGPMELHVDGRVELTVRPDAPGASVFQHTGPAPDRYWRNEEARTVSGRITRCDPPYLLSYTWGEEGGDDAQVTFELMPRHGTVILFLTQRRRGDHATMVSVARGWHACLGILLDYLYGRVPQPLRSTHTKLEAKYERQLATHGPTMSAVRSGPTCRAPHSPISHTSTAPPFLPDYDNAEDPAPLTLSGCHAIAPAVGPACAWR
jgi:uncharacterized protein YndB with AHSA1/START domain